MRTITHFASANSVITRHFFPVCGPDELYEPEGIGIDVSAQWDGKVQSVIGGKDTQGDLPKAPSINRVPDNEGHHRNNPLHDHNDPPSTSTIFDDLGVPSSFQKP